MRQCIAVTVGRSAQLITAALSIVTLAACDGSEAPSAERFCGEVQENRDQLTNPSIAVDEDIDDLLDLYREIGALAPLAVADNWNQIVSAYETASTVVIGDEASEQEALVAIYRSERSAAAVDRWLQDNCGVDIGPVFTVVPQGPASEATVPPTSAP
jgi:hypothetical protein